MQTKQEYLNAKVRLFSVNSVPSMILDPGVDAVVFGLARIKRGIDSPNDLQAVSIVSRRDAINSINATINY